MPPINHKTDVEHTQTVYEAKIQECNNTLNGDDPYTTDAELVETLEAAIKVALTAFDGDDPSFNQLGTGLIVFYEPHGDGEEYKRVVIKDRKVYN